MPADAQFLKDMTVLKVDGISILEQLTEINLWSAGEEWYLSIERLFLKDDRRLSEYMGRTIRVKHDMGGELVDQTGRMTYWGLGAIDAEAICEQFTLTLQAI